MKIQKNNSKDIICRNFIGSDKYKAGNLTKCHDDFVLEEKSKNDIEKNILV